MITRHTLSWGMAFMLTSPLWAQEQTVGLFVHEEGAQPGYTLISGLRTLDTYLIDLEGRIVNEWLSKYAPGDSVYLLDDGSLLRAADAGTNPDWLRTPGVGGIVEIYDWEGDLSWTFSYNTTEHRQHHDVEPLPNGNILMIAYELRTAKEAIQAGRDPALLPTTVLYSEQVIEVERTGPDSGRIVWQWNLWDHLVQDFDPKKNNYGDPTANPGKVDINFDHEDAIDRADWIHLNAIDYNEELDQILLTSPIFSEIWIIDHSISTEEASGDAGDLLYRWGNPQTYNGTDEERSLFGAHDGQWVPPGIPGAGKITIFSNGGETYDHEHSTVEELIPPLLPDGTYELNEDGRYGPEEFETIFIGCPEPEDFYAQFISGAERQANGNILACEGTYGRIVEKTMDSEVVWEYVSPVIPWARLGPCQEVPAQGANATMNMIFRGPRYTPDFPGFDAKDLTPGEYLVAFPSCLGDLDGNRVVNGSDLTLLLGGWMTQSPDIDGDEYVDGADLAILLGAWGHCPDC